ncbi:MAG: hypothetical protein DMG37_17630 [Acidobacteria bacterium]|nr:MAG: hypothetical protein DMG37_17630 [Acidobacteriota bacterium]
MSSHLAPSIKGFPLRARIFLKFEQKLSNKLWESFVFQVEETSKKLSGVKRRRRFWFGGRSGVDLSEKASPCGLALFI